MYPCYTNGKTAKAPKEIPMLSDLRILDLTSNLPGPYATMLLADLGARVLKVERPPLGDPSRTAFGGGPAGSPQFQAVNRLKKSLTLNLKTIRGREILLALLNEYDILIEGFRPGVMDRLGLSYQELKQRQPRLIYLALTGFGQNGPWRDKVGHDLNYMALAGAAGLSGTAEGDQGYAALPTADLGGGSSMALMGLLTAVIDRNRTGRGRFVDVSMFDGMISWLTFAGAGVRSGLEEERPGQTWSTGRWPCYRLYQTSDERWMSLAALEDYFWEEFCRAVGREEMIPKAFDGRETARELEAMFAQKTQAQWVELLEGRDCCCEPVLGLEEARCSDQARARGLCKNYRVDGREYLQVACPVKFEDYHPPEMSPAPELGQHNREILEGLGYDDGEIGKLEREGVI